VAIATRADSGATNALALRQIEAAREERQHRVDTPRAIQARDRAEERASDRAAAESTPRPSAVAPAASVPPPLQDAPAVERAEPRADLKPTRATPTPSAPARLDGVVVTGQAAQPVRARDGGHAALTTSWTIIPLDAARPTLGFNPVTIPGLPVRDMRRSPLGDGVILVEQAVDGTTLVQLFQRRADQAEASLQGAPSAKADGVERLARFVGGLRVEIAGPLPTDSLSKLLELVR
jgi:hypothetical protein